MLPPRRRYRGQLQHQLTMYEQTQHRGWYLNIQLRLPSTLW